MTQNTTQTVIQRPAPEIEAAGLGIFNAAQDLINQPTPVPTQQIAGFSGLQSAATGLAGSGIGNYVPYLEQAGYTTGDAQGAIAGVLPGAQPYQQAATQYMTQAGQQIPGQVAAAQQGLMQAGLFGQGAAALGMAGLAPSRAQAFFNPYEDAAVQQAMQDIRREGDIAQQGQRAQAVGAGAFGGSRSAIAEAELGRNVLQQQARTAAQMRQAGFESAAQRAQQAAQLYGQLGQAGAGTALSAAEAAGRFGLQGTELGSRVGEGLGSLGLQYGSLGLQAGDALSTLGLRQAALGETAQQMGQQQAGFLFDMGARQQAQQQGELDALYRNQMAAYQQPYQNLGFVSDILRGTPSSQMTSTAGYVAQASPVQQFLGTGIAGLTAAANAQRVFGNSG